MLPKQNTRFNAAYDAKTSACLRGIHIEELEPELEGDIDLLGFPGLSHNVPKGFTQIRVKFKVKTNVDNAEGR